MALSVEQQQNLINYLVSNPNARLETAVEHLFGKGVKLSDADVANLSNLIASKTKNIGMGLKVEYSDIKAGLTSGVSSIGDKHIETAQRLSVKLMSENLDEAFAIIDRVYLGDITEAYDASKDENDATKLSNVRLILNNQRAGLFEMNEALDGNLTRKQYYLRNRERLKTVILTRINILKTVNGKDFYSRFNNGKYNKEQIEQMVSDYVDYLCTTESLESIKSQMSNLLALPEEQTEPAVLDIVYNAVEFCNATVEFCNVTVETPDGRRLLYKPGAFKDTIPQEWGDELITFDEVYKWERGTTFSVAAVQEYAMAEAKMKTVVNAFNKKQEMVTFADELFKNRDISPEEKADKIIEGFAQYYMLSNDGGLSVLEKIITQNNIPLKIENGKIVFQSDMNDYDKNMAINLLLMYVKQEKEAEFEAFCGDKSLDDYQQEFETRYQTLMGKENSKILADAMAEDNLGFIQRKTGMAMMGGVALNIIGGLLCCTSVGSVAGAPMMSLGTGMVVTGMAADAALRYYDYSTKDVKDEEELNNIHKDLIMNAAGLVIGYGAGKAGMTAFNKLIDKKLVAIFGEQVAQGNRLQALKTVFTNPTYLKSFMTAGGAKLSTDFVISYAGDLAMMGVLDPNEDWQSLLMANLTGVMISMATDGGDLFGAKSIVPKKGQSDVKIGTSIYDAKYVLPEYRKLTSSQLKAIKYIDMQKRKGISADVINAITDRIDNSAPFGLFKYLENIDSPEALEQFLKEHTVQETTQFRNKNMEMETVTTDMIQIDGQTWCKPEVAREQIRNMLALKDFLDTQSIPEAINVTRTDGVEVMNNIKIGDKTIAQIMNEIGVSGNPENLLAILNNGNIVVSYDNFVGTSLLTKEQRFPNGLEVDQPKLLWDITVPQGSKGAFIENLTKENIMSEMEFLLQAGSQLKITGAEFKDGVWHLKGELISGGKVEKITSHNSKNQMSVDEFGEYLNTLKFVDVDFGDEIPRYSEQDIVALKELYNKNPDFIKKLVEHKEGFCFSSIKDLYEVNEINPEFVTAIFDKTMKNSQGEDCNFNQFTMSNICRIIKRGKLSAEQILNLTNLFIKDLKTNEIRSLRVEEYESYLYNYAEAPEIFESLLRYGTKDENGNSVIEFTLLQFENIQSVAKTTNLPFDKLVQMMANGLEVFDKPKMYETDSDIPRLQKQIKDKIISGVRDVEGRKFLLSPEIDGALAFIDDKIILEYINSNLSNLNALEFEALVFAVVEADGTLYFPTKSYIKTSSKLEDLRQYSGNKTLEAVSHFNSPFGHSALSIDLELSGRFNNLRDYFGRNSDLKIAEYLYENYYLKTLKEFGHDEVTLQKLRDINRDFGVKIMLSSQIEGVEETLKVVRYELEQWRLAGGDKVKYPPVLDFNKADRMWYDSSSAYGSGVAAGYSEASSTGSIAMAKQSKEAVLAVLRHEMMHTNDLRHGINIDSKYDLDKIMPKTPRLDANGNQMYDNQGRPMMIIDIANCMYVDEFRRAGISEGHIPYAYNNTMEFIAVAAEGDMSKYSPEFKQILIDFGMPEWAFKLKNNEVYIPKLSVQSGPIEVVTNKGNVLYTIMPTVNKGQSISLNKYKRNPMSRLDGLVSSEISGQIDAYVENVKKEQLALWQKAYPNRDIKEMSWQATMTAEACRPRDAEAIEHFAWMQEHPELFAGLEHNASDNWLEFNSADKHQGPWKIHLFSDSELDWRMMAEVVIPYLKEHDISWKTIDQSMPIEELYGDQAGKAFTIYPKNNEEMAQIARDLDYIIRNNNLQRNNSNIIGDRQMGSTGRLFYRYEWNSSQYKDEVLDCSYPENAQECYERYDANRGNGNYLPADMSVKDDIWFDFDPSKTEVKKYTLKNIIDINVTVTSMDVLERRFAIREYLEKNFSLEFNKIISKVGNNLAYKIKWEEIITDNSTIEADRVLLEEIYKQL